MKAKIAALVAAVTAAAATAGAAAWAKRKTDEDEALEREILETVEAEAMAGSEIATIPVQADPNDDSGASDAGQADDLTTLKGIGAVSSERLAGIGVTRFAQLAAWSEADIDTYGARIKVSPERIRREDWVGQARTVVEG